ncbi:MAG: hypothetical protein JO072_07530, partial [Parafilimonas sp.]|nr:hypothetical protein [Parafilimonas sp.]
VNNEGNIVLCGAIRGSQVDFDPGPNTYYANSGPSFAHFIAAYNANGDFLFESNGACLNSSSSSQSFLLKTDKSDNIICEGYLGGSIKLDSRFDSAITANNGSLYFIKYSSTGIPLFIKTLYASNQSQQLTLESLALDNANNIYIAGEFNGKVDFDAGPDSAYLISQTTMHSGNNAYLAKYDSLGNYLYAYNFAPIDSFFNRGVYKMDLYINKNDEITWGLNTNGSIDFDPGIDTFYYHSPLKVYQNLNGDYSFVIVKFKQTQTAKPFNIYALSTKADIDKPTTFSLDKPDKHK